MKKAVVTFVRYHVYEVEISDEIYHSGDDWGAIKIAKKDFVSDMCSPIADISYDDVEVEYFDEEDEE